MSDKPIVLMLDEADALVGDTLISLLRQIRAGYSQRPEAFPLKPVSLLLMLFLARCGETPKVSSGWGNALGYEMTWKDKTARDRSAPIQIRIRRLLTSWCR